MDRQRKPNSSRGRPGTRIRHGGSQEKVDDKTSRMLKTLQGSLGNQGLEEILNARNGKRDELLKFVCERLGTIRKVQMAEAREWNDQRQWHKDVFRGKDGYHLPEPGRWKQAAEHFKKAGEALCQGNLGQAKQYMEDALAAEQAAFDAIPVTVREEINSTTDGAASEAPEAGDNLSGEDTCGPCAKPAELKLADRIIALNPTVKNVGQRSTRPHSWFLEEEEEEEQEDGA